MQDKRKQLGKLKADVVFPLPEALSEMPVGYTSFVEELRELIKTEKFKIIQKANHQMILMYWNIGLLILNKQKSLGWGSKVIDRLSVDLKTLFPEEKGYSPRNLKYMRKFAESWPDFSIVQRTVAQIPWRSNVTFIG